MAFYLGREANLLNPSYYGELKNWHVVIGDGAFQTDPTVIKNMPVCHITCQSCTAAGPDKCASCLASEHRHYNSVTSACDCDVGN
jgi:hypothetical protein